MEKKKKIGGIVALIAGIVLVLGSITTIIVIQIRKNKDEDEEIQEMDLPTATAHLQNTNTHGEATLSGSSSSSVFTTEQIKVMQTYLLQLGIQHNNQYIIDAIQLTGGIDGKIGSGFHAAVKEARDRGYLTGYEDILRRLGYS